LRSQELKRLAIVRRKHGMIHKTYAVPAVITEHICRNG